MINIHQVFQDYKLFSKSIMSFLLNTLWAYSRPLLGATTALSIVAWVLRKIFSLKMVKNDICLVDSSKQNTLFAENVPQKTHPYPPMSRIDPDIYGKSVLKES